MFYMHWHQLGLDLPASIARPGHIPFLLCTELPHDTVCKTAQDAVACSSQSYEEPLAEQSLHYLLVLVPAAWVTARMNEVMSSEHGGLCEILELNREEPPMQGASFSILTLKKSAPTCKLDISRNFAFLLPAADVRTDQSSFVSFD